MAVPFLPKVLITPGADDTSLNLTDISNYNNNDDGIDEADVVSRGVSVIDKDSIVIAFIPLTLQLDGSYMGNYPIPKDVYYRYRAEIVMPASVVKLGETHYVSTVYYNASFVNIMKNQYGDCGCGNNICSNLTWAMHNENAAIIFAAKEMGLLSQQAIDAANTFLTKTLNG